MRRSPRALCFFRALGTSLLALLALLTLAFAPLAAYAQSDEIVVTGTRIEENVRDALVNTDVVSRKDIERSGARNAAELLEERAGVTVSRSFGGSAIWLRGLDPEYTLILVDGDRVPGQIDGAIDLGRFSVENIERIEIVRGPGSALYGADAIGGVINVITRESKRDLEADASIAYGQANVLDLSGRAAAKLLPPLRLQLTGAVHHADGFGTQGMGRGSEIEAQQGGFKLWLEPDLRHRFVASATYIHQTFSGIDSGAGNAIFDRTQEQEQLSTSLSHRLRATPKVELTSRASYSQFREQYLSDQRRGTALDRYEDNREHLGQLSSVLSLKLDPAHKSTLGLEHLFQVFDSQRLAARGNRYRLGMFAQHAWRVWRDTPARFDVVPGVRVDIDSQFGTQLSPKVALRYKPSSALMLRASYGRGYRAPSFQELLLRFENPTVGYVVGGNPDLGAETSHGVDAGIEWSPSDVVELGATFFRNDLRNMIAIVTGGSDAIGTMYTYSNLATAWTMGVESSASVNAGDWLSALIGYTFMETWDGENRRVLEGRPKHRLNAALRVAYPAWGLELGSRFAVQIERVFFVVDEQNEAGRPTVAPALAQLDLRIAKQFFERLELAAGIDNVLDAGDRFTVIRPRIFYGGITGKL